MTGRSWHARRRAREAELQKGRGVWSDLIPGEIGATARSGATARLLQRGTGLVAIVASFLGVTLAAGVVLVSRQRRQLRENALAYVDAVAEFRATELDRWLAERRGDALVASRDALLAAALDAAPDAAREDAAKKRLALIARSYGYRALDALDLQGRRRFGVGAAQDTLAPTDAARTRQALESGALQILGPRVTEGTPPSLTFDLVTPVFVETDVQSRRVGALLLRFDPSEVIAGVLGVAPAASHSGEMTLVVHDGPRSLYLYPKRRGTALPWLSREPLGGASSPEVAVARGATDLSQSLDETGSPVIATARELPGWHAIVVGHIRESEMLGAAARAIWLTVGLLAVLFLAIALRARGRWMQRTRAALLAKEEKFRIIFENMQDGYLLSGLDGRILLVNPATLKMLGYASEGDLLGKHMQTDVFMDPADREDLKARLRQSPDGTVRGHKATFKRADGAALVVEGNVRVVHDEAGAPAGIEGFVRDMTTHYQIRADLIAAREAAEEAARSKSQFLANMSHEIRTPLNAIVGLGHLLLRSELPPRQLDYVAKIQSSARMLLGTVDDVLDVSKIEAGKLELERTPFRLDRVLEDIRAVLSVQADAKNVAFVLQIGRDVPFALLGDPFRLGQVLTNLVGDALKFTEAGSVTLGVELVRRTDEEARLRFCVRDTGIGISEPQLARIFEPFTQADGSTTRRFGGTGLGLTICREVVEAMHGRLEATSAVGAGSAFGFEVPFALAADDASGAPRPAALALTMPARLRGARVLLAEDNAINQQVACELLEGAGVTVVVAADGRAAVERVAAASPALDAVLMDLQMPGMDGVEATRAIRADPAHAHLPIIAMTAHAEVAERERCFQAGMNDYVSKPFEPAQLFNTLARWLRQGDLGRPAAPADKPLQRRV
jgi:PAS domain S-box-containing protein